MPAKPSGEIKTKIVHQPQKNGDIYVLERQTIYDPEKKYNKAMTLKVKHCVAIVKHCDIIILGGDVYAGNLD